tara:strand:+ start:528 stop:800 length:273 start_codon:yes stop_codon:yes gene_type:complete
MLNLNIKIMMKDKVIVDYDKVQDALEYFQEFRMEELKQDDAYYIKHMIRYIEFLEYKIDIKNKVLSGMHNHVIEKYFDEDGNAKQLYFRK